MMDLFRVPYALGWLMSLKPAELRVYLAVAATVQMEPTEGLISERDLMQVTGIESRRVVVAARDALTADGRLVADPVSRKGHRYALPYVHQGEQTGKASVHYGGHMAVENSVHLSTTVDIQRAAIRKEALAKRQACGDFPNCERNLTEYGASKRLVQRIVAEAQGVVPDITDDHLLSVLRAVRRPYQEGPGLYLHTVPEFLLKMSRKPPGFEMQSRPLTDEEQQQLCELQEWETRQAK